MKQQKYLCVCLYMFVYMYMCIKLHFISLIFSLTKKLKDVAFPRTDALKKELLKKYNAEYQEYMQDKVPFTFQLYR